MSDQVMNVEAADSGWKSLTRVGGVAALLAGVLFRRNLAVEVALFSPQPPPEAAADWFTLLQNSRLLGLTYLHVFDLANYLLVGSMFLALYAVLRRTSKSLMTIAAASGLVGTAVYFASNTAFSMLSLSQQYAAATTNTQRSSLEAAGEALLAINRFTSPGAQPGAGGYMSLLLVAVAGLLASLVMLRSDAFRRGVAYVGILATALDLAYCVAFAFLPVDSELLSVIFIPAAGLLLMIWHIMVGWRLFRLSNELPHLELS